MAEADDFVEGVTRDVLLKHLLATFNAEAVLTAELDRDVIGDWPGAHLDFI